VNQLSGRVIYKIVTADQWSSAEQQGEFLGAAIDLQDGYIHFSTGDQVKETVEKHFQGQLDLLIVAVDVGRLGHSLKWEPSRGGDLFPHLYGKLSLDAVISVDDLPLGKGGAFIYPAELSD
jgi:uncharacterized protein (DUF952 family)